MTTAEFKNVFRSVISGEFETVPAGEGEIAYSFSQSFEQRMQKLIKAEKTTRWHWVNTAGKRAAIIIVALLCVLSATFSVKAIREPVVNFIIEVFDGYSHIRTESETKKEITYECVPGYIPDGYVLQEDRRDFFYITRTYTNEKGDLLQLHQDAAIAYDAQMDNEHGEISQVTVDGNEVILYKGTDHNAIIATWIMDGYIMNVTSYGDLTEEEILEIIRNYK